MCVCMHVCVCMCMNLGTQRLKDRWTKVIEAADVVGLSTDVLGIVAQYVI